VYVFLVLGGVLVCFLSSLIQQITSFLGGLICIYVGGIADLLRSYLYEIIPRMDIGGMSHFLIGIIACDPVC
jgi:hypothetical protein